MSKPTMKRKVHPVQTENESIKIARTKLNVNDTDLLSDVPIEHSLDEPMKSVKSLSLKPNTVTTNSSPAYSTTGSDQVDLFFSTLVRGTSADAIERSLDKSWSSNPLDTLRLVAQSRDCRGGKGEKLVSYQSMLWLRANKPKTYLCNLLNFLDIGCFKDLLQIVKLVETNNQDDQTIKQGNDLLKIDGEPIELHLMAEFLRYDWQLYTEAQNKQSNNQSSNQSNNQLPLSLAAKWAPSEGGSFDRAPLKFGRRLAKLMFGKQSKDAQNVNEKTYLKSYRSCLSALRTQLVIIEKLACSNQWSTINYSSVPAKCHLLLKATFKKHDEERYTKYLEDLKTGKTTIKSTSIMPHELVNQYLTTAREEDATVEAQWNDLINKLRAMGKLERALSVVDVSGSMSSGKPRAMDVAIALGLVVAELTQGAYHNRVITFHSTPSWHLLPEGSLQQRVSSLSQAEWGMSTNLQATFDLILKLAIDSSLPADAMPTKLFIFSDMQFDSAMRPSFGLSDHEVARVKFAAAGYQAPSIIYWNLVGGHSSVPVTIDSAGTAMLSGFSSDLLKQVLEGEEISVMNVMKSAIDKYKNFKVAKQEW